MNAAVTKPVVTPESEAVSHADTQAMDEALVVGGADVEISLDQLFIAVDNVRKTRSPAGIPELAALIKSQGLLQRLSVYDYGDGRFAVAAGGRRLMALKLLVEEGDLTSDALIECKLYDSERAVQISLAENSGREEMHPADEMEAYRRLIEEEKLTIEQVAGRQGVSPLRVERRLKLARLSPRFLMMYREGKIEPKQLQALALVTDHAKQEAVWDSLAPYNRSAHHISNALTQSEVEGDHRLAVFVGIADYEKAGGTVRRDLFAEDGEGVYFQDSALLDQLAFSKLQEQTAYLSSEGWAWVQHHTSNDVTSLSSYGRERQSMRKPTKAEAKALAALRAAAKKASAAYSEFQDAEDVEYDAAYQAQDRVLSEADDAAAAAVSEAEDRLSCWTAEQMARSGVVVKLDHNGKITVDRGLVRPEDKKKALAAMVSAGEEVPESMRKGARAEFSERLMKDMTAHRTAAIQAAMVANPRVALVVLVHRLAVSLFDPYNYSSNDGGVKISLQNCGDGALSNVSGTYSESKAGLELAAVESRWAERIPGDAAQMFSWMMEQTDSVLIELLAYCTARSVNVICGRERNHDHSDEIAQALGLDMADWWTPTPASFLEGISKTAALAAVLEATGTDCTKEGNAMKKAEAAAFCAAKLEGTRWLPSPLKPAVKTARQVAAEMVEDADEE